MLIRDLGTNQELEPVRAPRTKLEHRLAEWQRAGQHVLERVRARLDLPHLSALRRLRGGFVPRVDMAEGTDDLRIQIDLPGVHEQDVEAAVQGSVLTLRGVRRGDAASRALFRHERTTGAFERRVTLPCAVSVAHAEVHFDHGVLDLRLPKQPVPGEAPEAARARGIRAA